MRYAVAAALATVVLLLAGCEDHRARPTGTATSTTTETLYELMARFQANEEQSRAALLASVPKMTATTTPTPFVIPSPTGGTAPPVVRQAIAVGRAGDEAALFSMLHFRYVPCRGEPLYQQSGEPLFPRCVGDPVGTPYKSFPFGMLCERADLDPATLRERLRGLMGTGLRPVVAAVNPQPRAEFRVGAKYVVVFTGGMPGPDALGPRLDVVELFLDDTSIVHISVGCATPESLLREADPPYVVFDLPR